jgi:hypothetical protein
VSDVRRLAHLLVRRYEEVLQNDGVQTTDDSNPDVQTGGGDNRPQARHPRLIHGKQCAYACHSDQEPLHRHTGVDVDVRCAVDNPGRRGQQFRNAEPGVKSHQQQEHRREPAQMAARARTDRHAPRATPYQALSCDMCSDDADGCQHRCQEEHTLDKLQERQLKNIEGHVVTEYRVLDPERNAMTRQQPDVPLR